MKRIFGKNPLDFLPTAIGILAVLVFVALMIFGIRGGLRSDPGELALDETLLFDKSADGIAVTLGEAGFGMKFPSTLTRPVEVTLPERESVAMSDRSSDISSSLLSDTLPETEANRKLLDIITQDPVLASYQTTDKRKSDIYTYQSASRGKGEFKHWILYESGSGHERGSYELDGARVRLSDRGEAQVYTGGDFSGQPDFVIPRPYFLDKDGAQTMLDWTLTDSDTLSFELSVAKDRYPIAVDPTVQFDSRLVSYSGSVSTSGSVRFSGELLGPVVGDLLEGSTNYGWGLVKLDKDYAGSAIRVERSSDSTQTDIGFNSDGSLDTASLLSFVGSGDAYVITMYEQFGSSYDMTMNNDPLIVDDGVLQTHTDGSPAISFNPSGDVNQSGYVSSLPLYADMGVHYRVEVDVPVSGNVMLLEHSERGYISSGFYLNQEEWLHNRSGYIRMFGGDILDDTLTVHSLIHRQSDGGSRYEGTTLLANVNSPRSNTVGTETLYVMARENTIENVTGKLSALVISDNYDNTDNLSDIVDYMMNDWPTGAGWYSSNWGYRIPIVVHTDSISTDLTDFPISVDLADFPSSFFSNVDEDGDDIRVTKSDGITEVSVEVSQIDTGVETGELFFSSSGTLPAGANTTFYVYYDNDFAIPYAETATYGRENVWNDDYVFVSHASITDSTSNDNDGTANGGVTVGGATGVAGKATDFDGSDDSIQFPDIPDGLEALTITVLHKSDAVGLDQPICGSYLGESDSSTGIRFDAIGSGGSGGQNVLRGGIHGGGDLADTSSYSQTTNWQVVHFAWDQNQDSGNGYLYLDGTDDTVSNQDSYTGTISGGTAWYVGDGTKRHYEGLIGEVRFSSIRRSADWIEYEADGLADPGSLYSVGSVESE